jgi:hypothetical protein
MGLLGHGGRTGCRQGFEPIAAAGAGGVFWGPSVERGMLLHASGDGPWG